MSGLPPIGLVEWTRWQRRRPHPYEEWCYCDDCARGAFIRALLWIAFLILLVIATVLWAWLAPR